MEIETKIKKWDLIKLNSEGNYKQGEKTILGMGENNSEWNNWQRIHFQIIQAAHTIKYQGGKKKANQKVGKKT